MPKLVFINTDNEELHLDHGYCDENDAAGDLRGDAYNDLIAKHGEKARHIKEIRIVCDPPLELRIDDDEEDDDDDKDDDWNRPPQI